VLLSLLFATSMTADGKPLASAAGADALPNAHFATLAAVKNCTSQWNTLVAVRPLDANFTTCIQSYEWALCDEAILVSHGRNDLPKQLLLCSQALVFPDGAVECDDGALPIFHIHSVKAQVSSFPTVAPEEDRCLVEKRQTQLCPSVDGSGGHRVVGQQQLYGLTDCDEPDSELELLSSFNIEQMMEIFQQAASAGEGQIKVILLGGLAIAGLFLFCCLLSCCCLAREKCRSRQQGN